MEAIGLFFTKFSDELLSAQIALLSFSLALGIYWMLIRKKKRDSAEWVPAALVRAYLDRMRTDEHETRVRLFGENFAYTPAAPVSANLTQHLTQQVTTQPTMVSNDPALLKEIEALRAQLSMADQRAMEFDRNLNGLKAEKGTLEAKLKAAAASAGSAASAAVGVDPAMAKEIEELRAKLEEYDVIADELANAKNLKKENDQLKKRVSALEAGGASLTVVPSDPAAAEVTTKISGVTEKIDTPVTAIPASVAKTAPAPAPAAAAPEASTSAAPRAETNTNVLAPVNTSMEDVKPAPVAAAPAPAAAGPEKSSKQKEEELLSEFEKMLAS